MLKGTLLLKGHLCWVVRRDKTRQLFAEALVLAQADVEDADVGAAAAEVEGAMHRCWSASRKLLGMHTGASGGRCSMPTRRQHGAACHSTRHTELFAGMWVLAS